MEVLFVIHQDPILPNMKDRNTAPPTITHGLHVSDLRYYFPPLPKATTYFALLITEYIPINNPCERGRYMGKNIFG